MMHLKNSKLHRVTENKEFDREGFVEELVDVMHYLLEIFLLSGVSADEMHDAFVKKGQVNVQRILNNY
jgi:hypothetical protein